LLTLASSLWSFPTSASPWVSLLKFFLVFDEFFICFYTFFCFLFGF
jgi:hypothetical protein